MAVLLGAASAQRFEEVIPADEAIEWAVYVPESYDSEVPAGLLVFINAGDSGKIPDEWKAIMERCNLIWIGANRSGNKVATGRRVGPHKAVTGT